MLFHGRDQRFRRHAQEVFIEGTGQCYRPFVQRGDFFQQVVINDGFTAQLFAFGGYLLSDQLCPFCGIRHYPGVTQFAFVFARRADGDFPRGVETVTAGGITGFQTQHFSVDHVIAEQHDQPVRRPYEFNS